MTTSTKRPKPKPGQSAGKQPTGKQTKELETSSTTQPLAKKNSGSAQATSKPANDSTPPAAKTSSGNLKSPATSTSETTKPAAKTNGTTQPATKTGSANLDPSPKTDAPATGETTRPAAKTSGSTQPAAKTAKTTGSFKATPKPEPKSAKLASPKPPLSRREQKREERRDEISRRIEERRQQREQEQRRRALKRWSIIGGTTLLVAGVIAIIAYQIISGFNLPAYARGETIDGIQCNSNEQLNSHYHAHLAIYVNGSQVPIPDDVGRQDPSCLYWLHTHNITGDDGVIHIESPDSRTFQLYQFFDIWGQTFTSTNFLGHPLDKSHTLTAYVYTPSQADIDNQNQQVQSAEQQGQNPPNFTVTPASDLKPYTGDPRKIELKPYELIFLMYGKTVPLTAWSFLGGE